MRALSVIEVTFGCQRANGVLNFWRESLRLLVSEHGNLHMSLDQKLTHKLVKILRRNNVA